MTTFVEFKLLDPDLQTVHGLLPFQSGDLYMQLNEPGSGAVKTALNIASADLVESGGFVDVHYRNSTRGGFFVENIGENEVNAQEESGKALEVSGRGALVLLEDAIVWSDGTGANKRVFSGTQAGMLIDLIDEAKVRGGLLNLSYDFTDTLDSDDVPWTDDFPLELTVGTSLLDVVRQIGKTGIDFNILPDAAGNFVLSAYKDGIGSDKSNTVYFRVGTNCEEVSSQEAGGGIRNVLLLKYKGGYTTVADAGSIAARRRREQSINYDFVQSSASAATLGSAELGNKKDPKRQISVRIYDGTGPKVFIDYGLGDRVTLDRFGEEASYRIRGIHLSWNENGYSEVIVDLNSMILENEIRITQDVDWLMNEWKTAHDANLLEVRSWVAIGLSSDVVSETMGVEFMFLDGDHIYIGGNFTKLGGKTATGLARYDVSTGDWLGMVGFGVPALCAVRIGTKIFIGFADGWVAQTDGGTVETYWRADPIEPGFYPDITCMATDGTDLYIGFNAPVTFDGVADTECIARYDVSADEWLPLSTGLETGVYALLWHNSTLYVGGDFDGKIKSWNGSSFSTVGAGLGDTVRALRSYGNNILAGGDFTGGISEWNGSSWATVGGGTSGQVFDIAVYLTDIYIVGNFTDRGNYIARYSGGSWWQLDDGLDDICNCITIHGTTVYVGGLFKTAGTVTVQNTAAYFTSFEELVEHLDQSNNAFDLAKAIHEAPEKTTIHDADEVGIWNSITQSLAKLTFSRIKTWINGLFVALTGNQTVGGVKTFTSFPVTPSSAPTTDYQVANKKYVDDNSGGFPTLDGKRVVVTDADGNIITSGTFVYNPTTNSIIIGGDETVFATSQANSLIMIGDGDSSGIFQIVLSDELSDSGFDATIRGGGTLSSPTSVKAGMVIKRWRARGFFGNSLSNVSSTQGEILAVSVEDWDATAMGTKLEFYVTPEGSTARTLAMTITDAGVVEAVVSYTPAEVGDWDPDPENVGDALDQLAERMRDVEGTRYPYPFGFYSTANPISTSPAFPQSGTLPSFVTYPKQYSQAIFLGSGTNNSSNYWLLEVKEAGSGTTVASVNTNGLTANAGYTLVDTTMALSSLDQATHKYLYLYVTKVGSPTSALSVHTPIFEYTLEP